MGKRLNILGSVHDYSLGRIQTWWTKVFGVFTTKKAPHLVAGRLKISLPLFFFPELLNNRKRQRYKMFNHCNNVHCLAFQLLAVLHCWLLWTWAWHLFYHLRMPRVSFILSLYPAFSSQTLIVYILSSSDLDLISHPKRVWHLWWPLRYITVNHTTN